MNAAPALRPYLAADAPRLAEIFRKSVLELTVDDYDEAQREAWAATAMDVEAFNTRLSGMLTLVATVAGVSVGFVAVKANEKVDLLYVHPIAAGHGIGTTLLDAAEKLAKARGAAGLTLDASDTAEPFFRKRGYTPRQRNSVSLGGEWLATTTMAKMLAGKAP